MAELFRRVISTVVWGGVVAGPLAALAAVQVPGSWSGPLLPVAVLVVSVSGVALWRRAATSSHPDRAPRPGDRQEH
jgi:hypothetical protein